jgi:hypothetical protein
MPTEVKAGHQRVFDHVARQPGILADDHAVAVIAIGEQVCPTAMPTRMAILRSWARIGWPANTVRPEISPAHGKPPVLSRSFVFVKIRVERNTSAINQIVTKLYNTQKKTPAVNKSGGYGFVPQPPLARLRLHIARSGSSPPCRLGL